ncbi:MAG: J domain-containing protein [Gammaproteobacteria bacterium]
MAKIHTHYDNLKVARGAPAEVIRAAYKVLSQKYHPDKNPGDEKAARIMAIINTAYNTLSDPVRRREHDDWIAAEEWEINWLESTRLEDGRPGSELAAQQWEDPYKEAPPAHKQLLHDPRWWGAMALCLVLGGVVGALLMGQARVMPVALASAMPRTEARPAPGRDERNDPWAVARVQTAESTRLPADIKALGIVQFVVPARAPDCEHELHALVAPNGEPWPAQSGYVDGFPVGNQGREVEILVDNTANGSPVLVKVYDLDRRSNVRHVYVLARDSMTIDKLAAGKYEVRYQNIEVGGNKADCMVRAKRATLAAEAAR